MKFISTNLDGAYLIEPEMIADERGFFARTFCKLEFENRGLNPNLVQCNISFNNKKGTLRGMHFQKAPHAEAKVVRCTQGSIYDVIIDLRKNSKTYTKWFGVELTAENRMALYVPEGFAHGFITLADNTEVFYQMSEVFKSDYANGVRWDDPVLNIKWPCDVRVISDKDSGYQDLIIN